MSAPAQNPLPAPVTHDDPHIGIGLGFVEQREVAGRELASPGVEALGAVQREEPNSPTVFGEDNVVSHAPTLLRDRLDDHGRAGRRDGHEVALELDAVDDEPPHSPALRRLRSAHRDLVGRARNRRRA